MGISYFFIYSKANNLASYLFKIATGIPGRTSFTNSYLMSGVDNAIDLFNLITNLFMLLRCQLLQGYGVP